MNPPNEFTREALPAAIRSLTPDWGIVLGSGLGAFVEQLEIVETIGFEKIPGLPASRVPGHAGRFVFAKIGGALAMIAQGRVHLYEGHGAREVAAGVRCMAAMGVRRLVLTNAAGAIHPGFQPGGWMMISDHLNLTGASPLTGGAHFFDMSEIYPASLRSRFAAAAAERRVALHEGCYAGLPGPQYETPAEVRMLRTLGADAVGMSTVLEAIQARALGIEVAGLSCLTNWGAGLAHDRLTHDEVLETGGRAAHQLGDLLKTVLAGGV